MRILLLLLIAILPLSIANAQSNLLVSFDLNENQLIRLLQADTSVAFQTLPSHKIRAAKGANYFEYNYDQAGNLYQILMFRNYTSRKTADRRFEELQKFFISSKATTFEEKPEDGMRKLVAVKDGAITDIYLIKNGKDQFQVKLIRRNPLLDPMKGHADSEPSHSFSLSLVEQP